MNEIWKDIPGYEGKYQVSDCGNVKSRFTGRYLKPQKNTHGYVHVRLYKNGSSCTKLLALLVWESFNGPIPKGMQVNHINEDKTDNRLDNLNLMTPKENSNWGTRNKRVAAALRNGKTSKPVVQSTLDGRFVKEYSSVHEIERLTGYVTTHIAACCRGKQKTSYGFVWNYK